MNHASVILKKFSSLMISAILITENFLKFVQDTLSLSFNSRVSPSIKLHERKHFTNVECFFF